MRHAQTDGTGNRASGVLSVCCGFYYLGILAIVVFGQKTFEPFYRTNVLVSNIILLAPVFLLVLGLRLVRRNFTGRLALRLRSSRFLFFYFAALLTVQLLVVRSLWFYPGWDVEAVWHAAAAIAHGEAADTVYFSANTNNASLAVLLSVPLWIAFRLGKDVPYTVLPYLSALCVNLACAVCMLCVRKLTRSTAAWLGALILCTLWIALSLIITIPYSDTFSILFPILALYVYISKKPPMFWKWTLISLLCCFGATIKPSALIILFAFVLVLGVQKAFNLRGRGVWRKALVVLAALIVGAVPGYVWKAAAVRCITGQSDPQERHTAAHYLMMGMNTTTLGGYSLEDTDYSSSFETLAERKQANLAVVWERFSSRGVTGNLRFFATKAYKAFADGSMAQSKSFLVIEAPSRTGWWAALLKELFFSEGRYNAVFHTLLQGLWITILVFVVMAAFGKSRRESVTAVLAITLAGLGTYLLLFEVWPRYLYLYSPIFVTLAAVGMDTVRSRNLGRAS